MGLQPRSPNGTRPAKHKAKPEAPTSLEADTSMNNSVSPNTHTQMDPSHSVLKLAANRCPVLATLSNYLLHPRYTGQVQFQFPAHISFLPINCFPSSHLRATRTCDDDDDPPPPPPPTTTTMIIICQPPTSEQATTTTKQPFNPNQQEKGRKEERKSKTAPPSSLRT